MRSRQVCNDIAKGIIIGLIREGISPADRELILRIALRGTQTLNARIQQRQKSNGSKPA
jgi:hypothetical protein